jgi:hypothetical protein
MSKVLIIAGVSILALGLVLGLALPSLAAPDEAPPCADDFQLRIVKGKVLEVRGANQEFDIQSGDEELTIRVDGDTKYFKLGVPGRIVSLARHWLQFRSQNQIPQPENVPLPEPQRAKLKWLRPFGEESEFSDIKVGDRVVVCAEEENSELLAKRVLIIKPTTYARVSGTITGISSSAITITPDGGEAVFLSYNESTVFILKGFIAVEAGQYAHAIYDSDNMTAKRVTVSLTSD